MSTQLSTIHVHSHTQTIEPHIPHTSHSHLTTIYLRPSKRQQNWGGRLSHQGHPLPKQLRQGARTHTHTATHPFEQPSPMTSHTSLSIMSTTHTLRTHLPTSHEQTCLHTTHTPPTPAPPKNSVGDAASPQHPKIQIIKYY